MDKQQKSDILVKRCFNTMLDHEKSNIRREAYSSLVSNLKKGKISKNLVKKLVTKELHNEEHSTSLLYISIKFLDLKPDLYLMNKEFINKYMKKQKEKYSVYEVRKLVGLYLLRLLPSYDMRYRIAEYLI